MADTRQVGTVETMTVDGAKMHPYALVAWISAVGLVALGGGIAAFLARRKTPEAIEKSIARKVAKKVELERQVEEDKKELARLQAEITPKPQE